MPLRATRISFQGLRVQIYQNKFQGGLKSILSGFFVAGKYFVAQNVLLKINVCLRLGNLEQVKLLFPNPQSLKIGGYHFESNYEKTFIGKRHSWRNDAVSDGGGAEIAHAEDLIPENSSDNTVEVTETNYTINGTTTSHSGDWEYVYGGSNNSGDADGNNLTIKGGIINKIVFGGINQSDRSSSYNKIIFNNGTVGWQIIGGYSQYGKINYNTVIFNGGSVDGLFVAETGFGEENGNTLEVNGGEVGYIWAVSGNSNIPEKDDVPKELVAKNNTVTINGGTIGLITGINAATTSTENSITISGGTINGRITGTVSSIYGTTVTDNSINIYNNPALNNAEIYGYDYDSSSFIKAHSGNTLNIYTKGLAAKNIANFDAINFYLPSNIVNGDTILTLSETSTNISGVQVNAGVVGNANLNVGDTVTLLTNAGTITDTGTTYGKLTEGVSLTYDLAVSKSGDNSIIVTINSVTPDIPEILPIIPPPVIPISPIPEPNFDFDSEGLNGFFDTDNKGWEIFASAGGGPMRYKVNNGHIDTTNQNVDLGAARKVSNMANVMTIAPVIDYQNTNYDSYLNDGTRARGNSKYTAGGFVFRSMNRNGFYYEGSFRAGQAKTDFASEDLDTTGQFGTVTYDTSQTILNGHLKLGKYIRFDKNNLLNVYGFYYHTHQGGSNADLSSGEHYNFSGANAGKLRLGYRMTTRTSKISQIYTGLAYQYEHDSGVTASYKGYIRLI